jgi:hypothetical protein
MKNTVFAHQTIEFLDLAFQTLDESHQIRRRFPYAQSSHWLHENETWQLETMKQILHDLEQLASKQLNDGGKNYEPLPDRARLFPAYSEITEVVPIYKEAVSLEVHKSVLPAKQMSQLLVLLRIPKHDEGVDFENHQFGYHFHYGKMKKDTLVRSNVLLTFDPYPEESQQLKQSISDEQMLPLFYEYHAEGRTKSVCAEAIGLNKRRPIYLVCKDVAIKRGVKIFKKPSSDAKVFCKASDF